MTTKAAPVFSGKALNSACSAWMPPADAPMATITGFTGTLPIGRMVFAAGLDYRYIAGAA